jgi:hypothetical protein
MRNKKLHKLYASKNIISDQVREDEWAGHVPHMGKMRNVYTFWLGNLKGRNHSEDLGVDVSIIKMDLREIRWKVMDCIHLALSYRSEVESLKI